MELTLKHPQGTVVDHIHDKVSKLEVGQGQLVVQLQHALEAVNRIEMALQRQSSVSEEYREELLAIVRRAEHEIETIKREQELIAERRIVNWIRKNGMVVTIALAVLTALWAAARWLMAHLHF